MRAVNDLNQAWSGSMRQSSTLTLSPSTAVSCRGQLGPAGLAQVQSSKYVVIDPAAGPQGFWWFPYPDAESYGKAKSEQYA